MLIMLDLFAYWAQPPPPNVNDKWCSTMSPLSWPRQFNSNYHFLHRSLHSVLTWRLLRSENENFLERDRTAGDWCGQLGDDECPQTHFCPTLSSLAQPCPAVGTFLCLKYHLKMIGEPAWTNLTTAPWVKSTYLHIFLWFSGVLKFCSWVSSPDGNLVLLWEPPSENAKLQSCVLRAQQLYSVHVEPCLAQVQLCSVPVRVRPPLTDRQTITMAKSRLLPPTPLPCPEWLAARRGPCRPTIWQNKNIFSIWCLIVQSRLG